MRPTGALFTTLAIVTREGVLVKRQQAEASKSRSRAGGGVGPPGHAAGDGGGVGSAGGPAAGRAVPGLRRAGEPPRRGQSAAGRDRLRPSGLAPAAATLWG